MLTPHVVRATDITPLNLQEIDTGTGTNVELRHISAPVDAQAGGAGTLPPGLQPHAAAPPPPAAAGAENAGAANPASPNPGGVNPSSGMARPNITAVPTSNTMGLQIAPPQTVPKVGGTFQVAVKLTGGQDVFSVPMQLHYDNSKLALINVDTGDFLGHDGQAIALVHRDDGVGDVVIFELFFVHPESPASPGPGGLRVDLSGERSR